MSHSGAIWRGIGSLRDSVSAVKHKLTCSREDVPGTITGIFTQDPIAALTFDDGPHSEYTPPLLEILRRHEARATFFMIGDVAQRHPQLIRRVAQEGHAIGNHSWDHRFFPSLSAHQRREQIRACDRALSPYGERLFRPPYGAQSLASRLDAFWLQYKVITWNLHANDWCESNPKQMADRLIQGIRPGSIILLHDAIYRSQQPTPQYNREPMLAAVALFLKETRRFRFVTVPELLKHGHPQWHRCTPQSIPDPPANLN